MGLPAGKLGTVLIYEKNYRYLNVARKRLKQANIEVLSANNSKSASEVLIKNNIDVTIANLITSHDESMDFLSIAMLQNPEMERVVLCDDGQKGIEALTNGQATSFIADPWSNGKFEKTIVHIFELRNKRREQWIDDFIVKINELPAQPGIYDRLIESINKQLSFKKVADIVRKDVAITAKILKIANTDRNSSQKIGCIEKAITMILGSKRLKEIVLSFKNTDQMIWSDEQRNILRDISIHSSLVGIYFPKIYKLKYGKPLPDIYHSVGFTHDIGKVIQLQYMLFRSEEIYANMKRKKITYHESEDNLGMVYDSHEIIGASFLEKWGLGEPNIEIARLHHQPRKTSDAIKFMIETFEFTDSLTEYVEKHAKSSQFTLAFFHRDHNLSERKLKALCQEMAEFYRESAGE